jgi:hypothetical protein
MESAANIQQVIPRKSNGRSRVTNGSKLLPLADGRSVTARRFRDVFDAICADLGGVDICSEGQKQLARRAAMLSAECEKLEAQSARGDAEFDLEQYGQMTDRLGRCLARLGLERRQRPVEAPPSLDGIRKRIAAAKTIEGSQ